MVVTVYSKPHDVCHKCKLTESRLAKEGVEFETVELDSRPDLVEQFCEQGWMSAPIVVVDFGEGATWTWADFRRDNIKRLGQIVRGEVPAELADAS